MKTILKQVRDAIVARALGRERVERLFAFAARAAGMDLLTIAYRNIGILRFENLEVSGERFLLERCLRPHCNGTHPVIFDVGANVGDYSDLIMRTLPHARVFAFEPNPETFEILNTNLSGRGVNCINLGMGSRRERRSLFAYSDQPSSPHASTNPDVLTEYHNNANLKEIRCSFISVDEFCHEHEISRIDLLKVDAEGHELEVINGSERMIQERRISCIQFEFGECDVFSRVFLRNFYEKLPSYRFFRLQPNGLISLGKYSVNYEIFHFQNIVAFDEAASFPPCAQRA